MVASFSNFYGKTWVVFCLKTLFLRVLILKPTERAQVFLKNGTRDFKSNPSFERSVCVYVTISESFKRFQYFNFKTNFLENENLEFHFLVETTKIENTSFSFKTALSEANVKTNRMATTKWTYHKEWSFSSNYFTFLENLFQF